jgi:PII-like signaling protein
VDTPATTGKLLRIFIDEEDRWQDKPLYCAIVDALRDAGFAGATVLKGIEGYGAHRAVHSARAFDLSTNLPVLIEVFECEEKVLSFFPVLREMVSEGLITLENVQLIRFSKGTSA